MKDTLGFMVTSVVDVPKAVDIDEQEVNGKTIFTIHADPSDIGKLIGKRGRVIRAIRDLVKLMATKENKYVDVTIAE